MKKFCKDLGEHATKIINYEKERYDTINKKRRKKNIIKKFVTFVKKNLIRAIKNIIK